MTFDECYDQVILLCYKDIKQEWESTEGQTAEISPQGSMRRLRLSREESPYSSGFLIVVTNIEGRDRVRIDGFANLGNNARQGTGGFEDVEELTESHIRNMLDELSSILEEMKRISRVR
jgi:hypothetical protein